MIRKKPVPNPGSRIKKAPRFIEFCPEIVLVNWARNSKVVVEETNFLLKNAIVSVKDFRASKRKAPAFQRGNAALQLQIMTFLHFFFFFVF
jgi:hypothetical protein